MFMYLCVQLPRGQIYVSDVVAKLVIAWIVPLSRVATEHLFFLRRFDSLGARCDTAAWDSMFDKGIVIATPVKRDVRVIEPMCLVEIGVEIAQLL